VQRICKRISPLRIRIRHETDYTYDQPVRSVTMAMRVMPRDHEGQVVTSWRIEPSVDGRLRATEDAFGNRVHHFQADGLFERLTIKIEGTVETTDTTGFVRGAADPVPAQVYLRDSEITRPDEAIILFARKIDRAAKSELEQLHMLMDGLHGRFTLEAITDNPPAKAGAAFERRTGSSIDMAHVFCAGARELGIPARVVVGYAAMTASDPAIGSAHVWAEAMVPDYGWIGFDPSCNLCPGSGHVRVAVGIDHADASPIRQARVGGGGETARSVVTVAEVPQ
jgi:transglutaminase-like putative cysteine protease